MYVCICVRVFVWRFARPWHAASCSSADDVEHPGVKQEEVLRLPQTQDSLGFAKALSLCFRLYCSHCSLLLQVQEYNTAGSPSHCM